MRVHHEDRVVADAVEEHAVLLFALPQLLLDRPASQTVALNGHEGAHHDQQTHEVAEDQHGLRLAQALLRIRVAQRQQAPLLVSHLGEDCLELLHEPLAGARRDYRGRRFEPAPPAQVDDLFAELDLLFDQLPELGEIAQLVRIVGDQVADAGQVLPGLRGAVPVGREMGVRAGAAQSPGARFDSLGRDEKALEDLEHFMSMRHPPFAGAGEAQTAQRECADNQQRQDGDRQGELCYSIQEGLGHSFLHSRQVESMVPPGCREAQLLPARGLAV